LKTEDVINRMYNWKMASAYRHAKRVPNFPKKALKILKELAEKYGDCGWNNGKVFDELREKNFEVADILGYEWYDEEDYWVPKGLTEEQKQEYIYIDD
jgi:hypothetical protein